LGIIGIALRTSNACTRVNDHDVKRERLNLYALDSAVTLGCANPYVGIALLGISFYRSCRPHLSSRSHALLILERWQR
jgi:hypothetical protein